MNVKTAFFVIALMVPGRQFGQPLGTTGSPLPPSYTFRAVVNAPYSALQVSESVRVGLDGNRIVVKLTPTRLFRDAQGRTRRESADTVEIMDPVEGVRYLFLTSATVAHRSKLPFISSSDPARNPQSPMRSLAGPDDVSKKEQLGQRTIGGVVADGSRETAVVKQPIVGGFQEMTFISEVWMASKLMVPVLRKDSSPYVGDSTTELKELVVGAPDSGKFRVPDGFTVVDETGVFKLEDTVAAPASRLPPLSSSFGRYPALSPTSVFSAQTGAPYSAVDVLESSRLMEDGTRTILSSQSRNVYRDSQGRTREERNPFSHIKARIVEINDPVAGFRYVFATSGSVVHRTKLPGVRRVAVVARPEPKMEPPFKTSVFTSETLKRKMLNGVLVDGERRTSVIPAAKSSALMVNEREYISVSETWRAVELGVTVLTTSTDLLGSDIRNELREIQRSEPDLGLFQPPSGYTIIDEPGEFQVDYLVDRQ